MKISYGCTPHTTKIPAYRPGFLFSGVLLIGSLRIDRQGFSPHRRKIPGCSVHNRRGIILQIVTCFRQDCTVKVWITVNSVWISWTMQSMGYAIWPQHARAALRQFILSCCYLLPLFQTCPAFFTTFYPLLPICLTIFDIGIWRIAHFRVLLFIHFMHLCKYLLN